MNSEKVAMNSKPENDVKDGIIYVIMRPCDGDTVYVGSSDRKEDERMLEHQNNYNLYLNGKYHYVSSYELVKYDDAEIYVVKRIKFKDVVELRQEEQKYIEKCKSMLFKVVNRNRAFVTQKEKKQYMKQYRKQYEKQIKKE